MKTILFIEDEQTLQKTLSDVLTKEGYKIISCLDGENGLKLAKKENPDLILLDLILPKITGFEVLKELRANSKTKETPIIILTNLEATENIEKALSLGATTYMVKTDYSLLGILERIKKTIGK